MPPMKRTYGIGIICILLGVSVGFNIITVLRQKTGADSPLPVATQKYPFLASFINDFPKQDRLINFLPLRLDLEQLIATESPTTGIYFEYMPTGISIGINEKQPFLYASLLKVPVVMAVYNAENEGKISLSDTLTITEDMMDKNYGDLWKQGVGSKITVKDAISKSLRESDNTAFNLLKYAIPPEELVRVFDFLDIPIQAQNNEAVVTPQNYVSIFRSLIYSSYLPPEDSNEILDILHTSTFTDGITAVLPKTIPVAHKMGINHDQSYVSDCGVIYHPTRPYFLCVMDNDSTTDKAEALMRQISGKIYTYLSTTN